MKIQFSQFPKQDKKSTHPTPSDLFNIDKWSYQNKLFVHPAYRNAVKRREKLLFAGALIIGIFISILLIKISSLLR